MSLSNMSVKTVGALLGGLFCVSACVHREAVEPLASERTEQLMAITQANELIRFNAGQPQRVMKRQVLLGLAKGEQVVGMDYRVARGVLYVMADSGQLYTLNPTNAQLTAVAAVDSSRDAGLDSRAKPVGFDFNPAADRLRVVNASGQNGRMHPDTGQWVQADGMLAYAAGDIAFGQQPQLAAAAYTYHAQNDKLTTNYAIDVARGSLVMQGSQEGVIPVVSPNTGQLRTVGPLGLPIVSDAAFDIADVNNAALAALNDGQRTRLYDINLGTGRAKLLGTVADGKPLLGLAIEP